MPGVKLHHPSLRSSIFTIEHQGRRYSVPFLCPTCGKSHTFKTYHLTLDANGDVVVSETVYERLREADPKLSKLRVGGMVKKPKPIVLSMNGHREVFNVVHMEGK